MSDDDALLAGYVVACCLVGALLVLLFVHISALFT